ncbi:thioredoxin-like protein [Hygrophoropsis aurantiaca]|uniref:Thioredoxin-like protein n=1 Tax=Hygrophoropsis aurantiaca TaxID=72124 RepID=A0ACB8AAU9_9AGAM|nr:thioredoxin-like protein [Hygrophoropsis aurantiaca]
MSTPQDSATHSQPCVIVHHLNDSRSQRILWLLEELEVPYELKKYNRAADRTAPKELLEISPLGKAPVISDGDITLAESGAIVAYLIERYGKDKDHPPVSGRIDDLYYSHYAEGSLMPLLVQKLIFTIIPQRAPYLISFLLKTVFGRIIKTMLDPQVRKHVNLIEGHLATAGTWFAGGENPTSADYMMGFPLEAMVHEMPDAAGPNMKAYVNNIQNRPAYKRALERGGTYAFAKL